MDLIEALRQAAPSVPTEEEYGAFSALTDEYEKLVGEEYENTIAMAYRFFLAGRMFQEEMDAEATTVNISLTGEQAANLIAGLLGNE